MNTRPTINEIEKVVCKEMDITIKELKSKSRKRPIPMARFLCMYFALKMYIFHTNDKLAKRYGKTHCIVTHAKNEVSNAHDTNMGFRESFDRIKLELT